MCRNGPTRSPLREEPNELVAGKALERPYPDLIWSAETNDGGRSVVPDRKGIFTAEEFSAPGADGLNGIPLHTRTRQPGNLLTHPLDAMNRQVIF